MSDAKVTATQGLPRDLRPPHRPRPSLSYTAWPGSLFLELREGDLLFDLTEHSEKTTVPSKTYPRVRVRRVQTNERGTVDIDLEAVK